MRVNNLYVWSNAEIGSNLEVKGAMAVTGSVTHSGNLTIGGNLAVTGTSEFSNAVNFNGVNVQFGTGVYLKATGGKLYAGSTGGGSDLDFVAGTLTLTKDFTQNNDLRGGIAISRGASGGNGANGIGTSISFNLENDAGTSTPAGAIEVSFEDATNGSEDTKINISGKVGGTTTDLLTFTGGKWQFYGGLDQVNITDTYIADKQIVLNVGGGASSGNACGIAVEENGKITGYIKIDTSRNFWDILTPYVNDNIGNVASMRFYGLNDDSPPTLDVRSAIEFYLHDATPGQESSQTLIKGYNNGAYGTALEIIQRKDVSTAYIGSFSGQIPMRLVKMGWVSFSNKTNTYIFPQNAILLNIYVEVETAFNDTGTDLLDIGVTGDVERYVADLDVSTAGWKTLTLTNIPERFYSGPAEVVITYTGQNNNATQGVANVYIEYITI